MQRLLLLLLGASCGLLSQAQYPARLVFNSSATTVNNHPFVVFNPDNNATTNPGTYLVIDNPNANAITMAGTVTANVPIIKSETELNKIRWATGSSLQTYVVPFSTGTPVAGVAIPLTVQQTSPGAGAGSIVFSTYNSLGKSPGSPVASGWNNYNYRPSDVTHMNDQLTGLVNNSKNAIDRFWIIDAGEGSYAYGTKPAVTITFAFDPLETQANGGNDAGLLYTANNLVAQRFNSAVGFWYDILPMGSQSGLTVSGVSPSSADFFRSWTLSNTQSPLPITLVAWDGQCEGKVVKLTWTTASEQDNHHFTIEKSRDANDWSAIGTVPGAGNSSSMISYSFTDDGAQGLAYYRLRQTDINGTTTVSNTIAAGCGTDNGIAIVNAWDDGDHLNIVVSSTLDAVYDLTLMDAQGKVMATRASQVINTGSTTLQVDKRGISTGIYMVQLLNSTNVMSRRVHLD
ncbi:MAG: T9SS type A sorting domain-containing protein [Flavobacteriales bacterium]